MALFHSPKTSTDGLVFMYDTGNKKSYVGEPTENIFLNPTFIGTLGTQTSTITDNWYFTGYTGDTGFKFYNNSTSPIPLKFNNEGAVITTGASPNNQNRRFYCDEVLEAGATYTVSAWIYTTRTSGVSIAHFEYGGATLNNGYFSSTSTHPNHVVGEWYYWEDTYTVGADYTSGLIGPVYTGSSDTILGIQRFQIEKKSHATPFVDGTRSATQGLIDRTGTSTITLSNLSYDSNAQMSFDGTDDQFIISDPGVGTSFSIEVVIKVDNYSNGPIFISPNSVGIDHFFSITGSGYLRASFIEIADSSSDNYTSTTAINTGEYYHVVISKTPSNGTIYVNGVAEDSHTPTLSAAAWTGDWRIGARWNNTYNLNGEIPILKVYNQALTSTEITKNFNAIRSRFGL